ncbi:unnamed protein product, partial [marine sediment metagenome]
MTKDSAVYFYPLELETIMRNSLLIILAFMVLPWTCEGKENAANKKDARAGVVTSSSRGLHGYISY